MKTMIALIASVLMTGCGGINTAKQVNNLPTLPDVIQLGHSVLSRDSIPAYSFPTITEQQRKELGEVVPDDTQVIGMREIEGKCTLEAYLIPQSEEPNDFKVYLMTRGKDGHRIHNIDLGRFHTSEHQGPMRFGGNRFYTTDAELTFTDDSHFTVHRVMTLTSHYLKDHTLTEMWRVEWDDNYEIDGKGYITFIGQQETYRTEGVDDPAIEEFKSRNRSE